MADVSEMTSLGSTALYGTFAIMGGSSLFFLQKLLTTSQPDTLESPKLKNCESVSLADRDREMDHRIQKVFDVANLRLSLLCLHSAGA